MTYYHQEVIRLTRERYAKEYLTQKILQAKAFIDQHFSEKICLEAIAGSALISKFHFIRLFKSFYGCTPNHYLTSVRISQAKKQLSAGASITTACLSVGFESISSFTALFKKITGQTPLGYQRRQLNKPLPAIWNFAVN